MEKATVGAILKKRVKEKGYTQEEFADVVGVKYSTLRKYMSGKSAYSYELLLEFSEALECSVDYLLGLSKSPIKEHHEIAEQTRLSEKAIAKIVKYAKYYDEEFEGRRFIKCLDMMICEDGFMSGVCDYLVASRFVNDITQGMTHMLQSAVYENLTVKKMGIEEDKRIPLESQQMINLVCMLKELKAKITPEFIEEIKKLYPMEKYEKDMKEFSEIFFNKHNQEEQLR